MLRLSLMDVFACWLLLIVDCFDLVVRLPVIVNLLLVDTYWPSVVGGWAFDTSVSLFLFCVCTCYCFSCFMYVFVLVCVCVSVIG